MFNIKSLFNFVTGAAFRFHLTPEELIAKGIADEAAAKALAATEAARVAAEAAAAETARLAAEAAAIEAAKLKPTDKEAKLLKEVMEKKAALKAAEEARLAAETKLKDFEGIDPAEVRALATAKKAAEEAALVAKGDWERLKSKMAEEHVKDKATVTGQLDLANAEKTKLVAQIAELTVGNAFGTSKFVTEGLTLTPVKARVIYGSHFEFKDGAVVAYDKPAGSSERTMLVDATGNALPFDAAMTKIIDADVDRDQLLRSKAKAGAGSRTETAAAAAAAAATAPVTGLSKIAAGLAKGIGK